MITYFPLKKTIYKISIYYMFVFPFYLIPIYLERHDKNLNKIVTF